MPTAEDAANHSRQQTTQPIVVQKYGGSSLANIDCLKRVAYLIRERHRQGERLCVVVSAMGDTTNRLLAQARDVSTEPSPRELDMLLTCGERMSMALLAMALTDLRVPCISFTGSQSGILTDNVHTAANIVDIRPVRVQQELARGKVVIIAGFQGVSPAKEITTLRRGGSDTTAVALAITLGARCCEIYSDVAGIHTADPRLVSTARPLQRIDPDSMYELASHGARVLNAQAVALARDHGIAIHARKTGSEQPGTMIEKADRQTFSQTGVAKKSDDSLLRRPDERSDSLCHSREGGNPHLSKHGEILRFASLPDNKVEQTASRGEVIALAHQNPLFSFVVPGSCRIEQALRVLTNQGLHIVHVGARCEPTGKNVETLVVTLPHPTKEFRNSDPSLPRGLKRSADLAAVFWISRGCIADSLRQALDILREQKLPVHTIFCSATRAGVFVDPTVMHQALQLLHDRLVIGI